MHNIPKTNQFVVAALYQFISVEDVTGWQAKLRDICASCQLMGTLLIADEGLNGTISGRYDDMHRFLDWLLNMTIFSAPELKFAVHEKRPFHRMKVRLKKEIVTMGAKGISPTKQAGTYVAPQEWNTLIADPDVMVVDTRNDYEVAIGQFQGAVNPLTKTFREFPQWAEELAALPEESRPKKLAMYCTGGIRCEKSTALMKNLGFDDVYHLKGASCNIWKIFRKSSPYGKVNVLFLTAGLRLTMICNAENMNCAMRVKCRLTPKKWQQMPM